MELFESENISAGLPVAYTPLKAPFFEPDRIYLSKGSMETENRRRFVESIISLFPNARVFDCRSVPHNQISFDEKNPVERHAAGKKTLVFGEHKSAVRFSGEQGNTCPNYWHFSPYGFCPYGCKYCYLAGTQGVWHSPAVKIFVNSKEIIEQIDKIAKKLSTPTAFYAGKLQDGLALDPLTGYSTVFVPFFASHEFARQVILTKSDSVENLLNLKHNGKTIVTWSLNPPEIVDKFEENVPCVHGRIEAMKKCAAAGYPVRAVIMPVIPVDNWEMIYGRFMKMLVGEIPIERITIGGICIYKNARSLMENRIGADNCISEDIDEAAASEDGRARYCSETRRKMYDLISKTARETNPGTRIALCLEEPHIWEELGLANNLGRCNCVL
jgi:DNA repair photolyase